MPPPELQLVIPAGRLLTVSEPGPVAVTVRLNWGVNVAATATGDVVTVKLQEPVPEQPPPVQPLNTEPAAAEADKVMSVGFVYVAMQVPEVAPPVDVQLMFV